MRAPDDQSTWAARLATPNVREIRSRRPIRLASVQQKAMIYVNKKGERVTREEYAKLFEDTDYRWVGSDELATGYYVSTVWLGLEYEHNFETMVFSKGDTGNDLEQLRYPTEEEALAGHARMVAKYSDPVQDAKRRLGSEASE